MPSLTFKYGPMGAAKSLDLLVTCYQYEAAGKRPCVIKPSLDTRHVGLVWSRVPGMSRKTDIELSETDVLNVSQLQQEFDILLVDESHWLSEQVVRQLYSISKHIPVVCYGLRTDFRQQLFSGSTYLLALADEIVEIKGLCRYCSEQGKHNLRISKKPAPDTNYEVGSDETFVPVCKYCFDRAK